MNIIVKDGVKLKYFTPSIMKILWAVYEVWKFKDRQPCVTSAFDGTHMAKSKHYSGDALDLRTVHLTPQESQAFTDSMKAKLGKDFDVILEKDHLHVEFDPK